MQYNMSRIISFIVLLAFIIVIGALFYKVMIGFLIPIFLAAVLVVVFRPVHRWIYEKSGRREHIAAGITTAIILFVVLLPAGVVITTGFIQGAAVVKNFNANNIDVTLDRLRNYLKLEIPHGDQLKEIQIEMEDLQDAVISEDDVTKLYSSTQKFGSHVKRLKDEIEALKITLVEESRPRDSVIPNSENKNPDTKGDDELPAFVAQDEFNAFEEALQKLEPTRLENEKPDIIDIRTSAVRLSDRWQQLKIKLLGGSTRAIWRDFANPNERELKAFRVAITNYLQPRLVELTSMTLATIVRMLVGCAILALSLYFFLYDGPRMMRAVMQLSPLDDRYEQELLLEFDRTSRAVVLATILSAIVQGLIAGAGYYVVGMPQLVLLILLTTTCALVPFVGPALVWVPVCLYLLIYQENTFAAAGLAAWGTLVVGTSDNFVKMFVLHGQRQLHPLLALLSVLGGVQSMGPIGILVGPMAVTMLQTLLGILQHELTHFDTKLLQDSVTGVRRRRTKRRSEKPKTGDVSAADFPADGPPPPEPVPSTPLPKGPPSN